MSKRNAPINVVTGFQPTGKLHIGNYLGAIRTALELQDDPSYNCFYFIADWHSMTVKYERGEKRQYVIDLATDLLALGVDPEKVTLFAQSDVLEHAELFWILSTLTPMAELERMTQYKDKASRNSENINAGLFTYPILQAADILIYKGAVVPVGVDQVQHVEITRDLAKAFNRRFPVAKYGETTPYFPETQPLLTRTAKIRSLTEPTAKMSKSHGEKSCLYLMDYQDTIVEKIKKVPTEPTGVLSMTEQEVDEAIMELAGAEPSEHLKGMAGVRNLIELVRQFSGDDAADAFENNQPIRYGDLKKAAAEAVAKHFEEFRARRNELATKPEEVEAILKAGAEKARAVARQTLADVRELTGLGTRR